MSVRARVRGGGKKLDKRKDTEKRDRKTDKRRKKEKKREKEKELVAYARLASEKNHEAGNRRAERNDILAKALTTRRATVFKAWTLFHDVSSREWQKRKEGHAK